MFSFVTAWHLAIEHTKYKDVAFGVLFLGLLIFLSENSNNSKAFPARTHCYMISSKEEVTFLENGHSLNCASPMTKKVQVTFNWSLKCGFALWSGKTSPGILHPLLVPSAQGHGPD